MFLDNPTQYLMGLIRMETYSFHDNASSNHSIGLLLHIHSWGEAKSFKNGHEKENAILWTFGEDR